MPETPPDPRSADEPCPLPPPFPVVGLGGSAGALEPLKALLEGLPPRPGAAFVVVQHLPPDHSSLLGEILVRHAAVPTVEVAEAMEMEPDRIYLAPPEHDLAIRSGRLVPERRDPGATHRPIDRFLTTLAHACGERAVAVILSGTGTDGTAGAREVRIAGGVVLAQDPGSAAQGSMPRAVVTARAADYVLSPEKAHRVLLRYIDTLRHEIESPERVDRRLEPFMESLLAALHARVGHDFRDYKRPTLERRVARRMSLAGIESPARYVRFLGRDPTEAEALRRDLLIGVSTLFRDPEAWDVLAGEALPALVASEDVPLRGWVAGCSTGEEAYSLAMTLAEALEAAGRPAFDFQLFATDVDPEALERARTGLFPREVEALLSPERLARFFLSEREGYRVSDELRATLTFARHDLLSDPPILGLHLISCRNVLIYLEPEVQERLVARFHAGLVRGGVLFLGKAEGPRHDSELFEPLSKRWRIYRRAGDRGGGRDAASVSAVPGGWRPRPPAGLSQEGRGRWAEITEGLLLHRYAPASALIDRRYQVLYLQGPTERFLAQPPGQLTRHLLEMAQQGLRSRLRTAVRQAIEAGEAARVPAAVAAEGGGRRRVVVTATPVRTEGGEPELLLVTFEDGGRTLPATGAGDGDLATTDQDVRHLEEELRRTQEELQSTIEELETSNEEVLSVNEELQTANEELEASKDELESLNEELAAANAELQETNFAVRRSEEMLRRVTDALPVLISYVGADGRFRMVNATYEAWFGRPRAEIEGRTVEEVLGEEVWAKTGPAWERALAGQESEFEGELTVGVKGPRYVSVVRVPHRDDEGRVRGVFNLITDLTAREKAAQALRVSEERYREKARALAEADRRKDEFLAMLGHELRNPLSPIRNAVEMLREHGAELDPEKAKRAVGIISRQLAQLTRLVDDLLDVARITRGQIRIERRPVRLASVLERAVETARPLFEARDHRFRLALPEAEVWVEADPDRLSQAVGNLLHNAAKFTPEGGEVSVEVARAGGRVVVRVRDSGPGIPEDILPHAFELFTQGAQSLDRSQGGLGLGLAQVRRLVEMQGGTVEARNRESGGAELSIELPVRAAPERAAVSAPPAPGTSRPRRVLVVDDNRDSADALSALLGLRGHTVVTVASGPSALDAAEELRPEAAILDIGLPEMDGFEVARRLRERFGAALLLVALTGYGRDQDRARGLEAGFDHYLLKPVSSEALERLLSGEDPEADERVPAAAE